MDNVMQGSNIEEDYLGISAVHFGYVNIVGVKLYVYHPAYVVIRVYPSVIWGGGDHNPWCIGPNCAGTLP